MAYRIEIRPSALKELADLPKRDRRRVARKIDALAENPRPVGAKKLAKVGRGDLYRVRAGDYRVIYRLQDKIVTVTVIKIGHRGDVYRKLQKK